MCGLVIVVHLKIKHSEPPKPQPISDASYTIAQLNSLMPQFDWTSFLARGIFKDQNPSVNDQEFIAVDNLSYLKKAAEIYYSYSRSNPW